ncbi:UNVERIFIED_CONTAM: hypothetical protein K2H54_011465 [Gekko kuhli]
MLSCLSTFVLIQCKAASYIRDCSRVASGQFPLPLIYLETSSDRLTEGASVRIFCVAPGAYLGAYFYLFMVGQTQPVQALPAPETQHQVAFLLENVTTVSTGLYRCQYGILHGSRLQPSALSDPVEIIVEAFGPSTFPPTSPPGSVCQDLSWILLAALGVTGVLLLGMTLLVAAMALRGCRKATQETIALWMQPEHKCLAFSGKAV